VTATAVGRVQVTYAEVSEAARRVADRWKGELVDGVYGIPRGGSVPAVMVAGLLGVPVVDAHGPGVLVVDDLVASGRTAERYPGRMFDALYRKPWSPPVAEQATMIDGWVVFPWELSDETAGPTEAVVRLLECVGEDPTRDGLVDTPGRVLRSLAEMTAGYAQDPATILATTFDDRCDEMVVVRGVEFTSLCEHHLLPFVGTAAVGYLPGERVAGLSKLARLVDCYARRLQVQERLTTEIAAAVERYLAPQGVGVLIRAHHSCMGCRGVRKPQAEMVTSAMLGALRDNAAARSEFLVLVGKV
jgi:GTP cyclohydrolase I